MKAKVATALFAVLMLMSSCYTAHFTVGDGPVKDKGKQETYDKAKQMWLFWGLVNINEGQPNTPNDGNYMIKTKTKFVDGLATGLTAGIFSMRTVKVKVEKVKE